jgi:hypothetical protein
MSLVASPVQASRPATCERTQHSSQSSINKLLLQLGNLSFELLNLLPTIQRPAIIQPQTLHQPLLSLFQTRISLVLNTLATLEFAAQLGDFL